MLPSGFSRIGSESKLILVVSRSSWVSSLTHLLKNPTPSSSLADLVSPPPTAKTSFKNGYIPLTRRTLFRELLQDASVILPSERENFEEVAISLDEKLKHKFHVLQDELSLLSQSIEPLATSSLSAKSASSPSSTAPGSTAFRSLSDAERLDQEFWLLRQISDLAPTAGFTEVSRDLVEKACKPHRVPKASGAVSFVDPEKFAVIHFWIRGIHHHLLTYPDQLYDDSQSKKKTEQQTAKPSGDGKTGLLGVMRQDLTAPGWQPKAWPQWAAATLLMLTRRTARRTMQAGRQLVASRLRAATAATASRLPSLLHHPGGQAAQLFEKGDLCFSKVLMAVRMKGDNSVHVKLFEHYHCGHNTGPQAIASLLRLAHEELFKASLLSYALLIRPSQAGAPLNPTQLGVRAESWLAKRVRRTQHIPLPASTESSPVRLRPDQVVGFTGGSGPLFDLDFCPQQPLDLLRRLDLVRGPQDAPTAVPVSQAASSLRTTGGRDRGATSSLSQLWLLDSLASEADLGRR